MEYTKQTWTAPTGTGLSRYAKSGETETHVELALDPVNLTNTPTPFTMARMAHMEEGIAKAYDTAPPTPWAQYSGKDIPQLPDNLAGTTYKRDNDWVDTDGWTASGGTISIDNNTIINTANTTAGYLIRPSAYGTGRIIILSYVAPKSGTLALYGTLNGVANTLIKNTPVVKGKENLIVAYVTETLTSFYIQQAVLVSGDIMRITKCYIGTGAYDRLVFDNSYHYRHLLNNAVIPTPQGLYFNGTSYLRSKEPVTLPDVFTFSATVNCAVSSSVYQRIFEILNNATSLLRAYRSPNTNNITVSFYNTSSASIVTYSYPNFFVDNTDVDLKIEIDFINKTLKVYKNNILFYNATATGLQKPTEEYLYIGTERGIGNYLLGYMRNICIYDTSLTDTQHNWLSQGNTPPILYDVTNYETEGYVSIQDADGTNTGVETGVDSNGNRILKLPATIKANVTGNADTASKANVRVSLRHGNTFFTKTWSGLSLSYGPNIWTDGDNIYYSNLTRQEELDKATSTWVAKTWTGLTDFNGNNIWTDGENIYYSNGTQQLELNKATSTWVPKTWTGLTNFDGDGIWTRGANIYYSNGATQYVLNKATDTWAAKIWSGLTNFVGQDIWTDGENIYYSAGTTQFVKDKLFDTWVPKTWTGLTNFNGDGIWTDGDNIYYSNGATQYVLNKATDTWAAKTWTGLTNFNSLDIWTDGENIYSSDGTSQYVLPATRHNYVDDDKYNSLFGTVTRCNCSTLSARFVFRNE